MLEQIQMVVTFAGCLGIVIVVTKMWLTRKENRPIAKDRYHGERMEG